MLVYFFPFKYVQGFLYKEVHYGISLGAEKKTRRRYKKMFTDLISRKWNYSWLFFFNVGGSWYFDYYLFIYLYIYFWLCWVFVAACGLSLVVASVGHSSSRCAGLSLTRPLLLQSTGSTRAGSVIVAHGPSCSAACGIFPDQGSNLRPLHWQTESQPLHHQGSP